MMLIPCFFDTRVYDNHLDFSDLNEIKGIEHIIPYAYVNNDF